MMTNYAEEFGDLIEAHTTYRHPDGAIVPSVTQVLSQVASRRLVDWSADVTRQGYDHRAIAEESARVGTLAHALVRAHLLGVECSLDHYSPNQVRLAQNAMRKFLEYCKWHKLEPLVLETPMVSEAHRYGGTPDFYGLCDGKPAILDWKTGSGIHKRHKRQAAAYWNLVVENGHPVESVRILRIGREEQGGYHEQRVGDLEKHFAAFLHLLAYYEETRGLDR